MNAGTASMLLSVIGDAEIELERAIDRGEELDPITIDEIADTLIVQTKRDLRGEGWDFTGAKSFVIGVLSLMPLTRGVIDEEYKSIRP